MRQYPTKRIYRHAPPVYRILAGDREGTLSEPHASVGGVRERFRGNVLHVAAEVGLPVLARGDHHHRLLWDAIKRKLPGWRLLQESVLPGFAQ
jgi:hypothetical protein